MTHPTQEDDVKPIRDALALGPTLGQWSVDGHFGEWGIASDHSVDGAACKSGRQFVAACFRVSKKDTPKYAAMFEATARYIAAANPERLTRLLAHIDAQAVLLVDAERLAAARLEQMNADRKQAIVWRDQAELYEQVRKFSPREFRELWTKNVTSGAMFDDLVRAAIASEAGK